MFLLRELVQLVPAFNIFKIHISHAFRHLRVDPGDVDLLGLRHQGPIFID